MCGRPHVWNKIKWMLQEPFIILFHVRYAECFMYPIDCAFQKRLYILIYRFRPIVSSFDFLLIYVRKTPWHEIKIICSLFYVQNCKINLLLCIVGLYAVEFGCLGHRDNRLLWCQSQWTCGSYTRRRPSTHVLLHGRESNKRKAT